MKARDVICILSEDGWYLKEQKGSHMQFIHPTKPGKVTVPFHGSDDIVTHILASIFKQAGLKRRF